MLDDIPTLTGAYVLVIDLAAPVSIETASTGPIILATGRYAYCGSAHGPGGLRARLRRHLRRDKKAHWHVDRLTAAGRIVAVDARPGGHECALADAVRSRPGVTVPVRRFGASDCRRCPAHLFAVPSDFALAI
jgi:Uri superfamily endonuclease